MNDIIWFIILLILIAASVALVFLILFGESAKKSRINKLKINICENQTTAASKPNDAELIAKLRRTFSDEEISRIVKIYGNIDILYNNKYNKKYK